MPNFWRMLSLGAGIALVAMIVAIALPARMLNFTMVSVAERSSLKITNSDATVTQIDEAYLVLASLAFEECEASGLGLVDRWRGVFGALPAQAGHGDAGAAPGQLDGPFIIELIGESPARTLGESEATAWSFCRAHLVAGQSQSTTASGVSTPDGLDLSGHSLWVRGTFDSTPFTVSTSSTTGAFVDVGPVGDIENLVEASRVELSFLVASSFAGFDPNDHRTLDAVLLKVLADAKINTD